MLYLIGVAMVLLIAYLLVSKLMQTSPTAIHYAADDYDNGCGADA